MEANLTPLAQALTGLSGVEEKEPACKNCGRLFKPKNEQQKHCSDNCRKQFNKKGKVGHKAEALIRSFVREEIKSQIPAFQKVVDEAVEIIRESKR